MCPVIIVGAGCLALIFQARKWHKTAAPRTHRTPRTPRTWPGIPGHGGLSAETCLISVLFCSAAKAHSKGKMWKSEGIRMGMGMGSTLMQVLDTLSSSSLLLFIFHPCGFSALLVVCFPIFFLVSFCSVSKLSINVSPDLPVPGVLFGFTWGRPCR